MRRRAARPVERDLERVLVELADDFPLLASLVERKEGGQRRLKGQQHLEERLQAQLPLALQFLDQVLEGHILISMGLKGHLPHPSQQFAR